jgi:hypothetical protein
VRRTTLLLCLVQTLSYLLPLLTRLQPWAADKRYRSKHPRVRRIAVCRGWKVLICKLVITNPD